LKLKKIYNTFIHLLGRINGRYYLEDYIRVYPGKIIYNRFGKPEPADRNSINNFLNHKKFYQFVAQFVSEKTVADIGCGSGYGCEIIKNGGAKKVYGCDASRKGIEFAIKRYKDFAEFSIQGITHLHLYKDQFFDVVISNEVLEHIKEYNKEYEALKELKRITKKDGIIIVGTPNSELSGDHGFYFHEINSLFKKNFKEFCIFENALLPFDEKTRIEWKKRMTNYETGIIISELINLSETVLPDGASPLLKQGLPAGIITFNNIKINTKLLHNTHSWVVLAIND
jgi:2-polyprenyl-3-methyl-5-hydroxy-6-metoxy-1,4-benzoquinol methylase